MIRKKLTGVIAPKITAKKVKMRLPQNTRRTEKILRDSKGK